MKAGEAVTMRLAPEDILTLIDVCEQAGMQLYGASLAQVCRLGVSALCEGARVAGLAPRHDGFDYMARLAKYKGHKQDKKLAVARAMEAAGINNLTVDLPRVSGANLAGGNANFHTPTISKESPDYRRKQVRMRELQFKLAKDPLNRDPAEQQEFDSLFDAGVRP